MTKAKIIIISGPSGSGKTTLYQELLSKIPSLSKSISVTTRGKRPGEVHGRDYCFVSKKMFFYKKRAGHFLEHEKVFDNYYGTPAKYVREKLKKGKHVLLCIDVKGGKSVRKKFPEAVSIFVKVPNLKTLEKRLLKRGSEKKKTVKLRLKIAREELKEEKAYRYTIINDDIRRAFNRLIELLKSEDVIDKNLAL